MLPFEVPIQTPIGNNPLAEDDGKFLVDCGRTKNKSRAIKLELGKFSEYEG